MADEPDGLEKALTPFQGKESDQFREALKKYLAEAQLPNDGAFLVVTSETVSDTDTVQESRLAYVLSLKRIRDYLWADPRNHEDDKLPAAKIAEGQAKIGLAFVKHIESSGLKALQIGRETSDKHLAAEVAKLREEALRLAEAKAEFNRQEAIDAIPAEGETLDG